MSSTRQVLTFMPFRGGLATAGKRSTVDEGQLWEATNLYPDLDGMLLSRPGLVQHGQTLTVVPDATAGNSFHETFADLNSWTTLVSDPNSATVLLGRLSMNMASTTASSVVLQRSANNTSSGGNYSVKFTMRLTNPRGAGTTDGGQLQLRLSGDAGTTVHQYVFDSTGISVTGVATPVYTPTYPLELGGPHTYELYYVASTNSLIVGFDGVLQTAVVLTGVTDVGFDGGSPSKTVEIDGSIVVTTYGDRAWAATITDFQYTDVAYSTASPFTGDPVLDTGQFKRVIAGGTIKSTLLAATGSRLYADVSTIGAWQPIQDVWAGHTRFLPFMNKLLIFDDDGQSTARVFAWDGITAPEPVTDAPPVTFGTEHRTRVFASGDRNHPLRVYFTGSRRYKVWFAPDYDPDETYDEVINAGYIDIPANTGEAVTGVYGEYFGSLIVQTSGGVWRVAGSSPASFQVENVSKLVGGSSPTGLVQLGNDLHGVGKAGVYSVQSAQTTGDFQTALPSGAIADKWSSLPAISGRVDRKQLEQSYFAALPSLNLAVLGMRGQGSLTLDQMMVYAPTIQRWYGPWTNNPTCFCAVEVGRPEVEVLLEGHIDGKVCLTGLSSTDDMGSTYTCTLASPMLNGRSLDPSLMDQKKTWRTLRVYLLPRAKQDFTVTWWVDDYSSQSVSISQDAFDGPSLSNDFVLDVDRLADAEAIQLIDVTLDAKGCYLHFKLESDYAFAYQGCQIEFMPGD